MRSHIFTCLFVAAAWAGALGAQEWRKAPPPLAGKASLGVNPPPTWAIGWPAPSLKDPGLKFLPGPNPKWVWGEGQDRPDPSGRHPSASLPRKKASEATVEVWDLSLPERPKERAFSASIDTLKKQVAVAMRTPPPRHGDLDLAYLMLSDPGRPQDLELAKMKSLHVRFNRLPPHRTLP